MIFYKLFCVPPNLEILSTSIYTFWCLCSREILSVYHLLDKINACWSINGLEENLYVMHLRYAVACVHVFQFIFAYVMLAAEIITIYPILFNKSATLLNPIIIASTLRQIYLNSIAVVLGALLCYFSGSDIKEFQCFFGKFLVNMIVSYYIILSYKDFKKYICRRSSLIPAESVRHNPILRKHAICGTQSENSFITDRYYRPRKKVKVHQYDDDSISRSDGSLKREKILRSHMADRRDDVDSSFSTSTIPASVTSNSKETFRINFLNHKTKANVCSFTISKKN